MPGSSAWMQGHTFPDTLHGRKCPCPSSMASSCCGIACRLPFPFRSVKALLCFLSASGVAVEQFRAVPLPDPLRESCFRVLPLARYFDRLLLLLLSRDVWVGVYCPVLCWMHGGEPFPIGKSSCFWEIFWNYLFVSFQLPIFIVLCFATPFRNLVSLDVLCPSPCFL